MKPSKRSKNLSLEGLPLNVQHRTLKIVCGADLLGERKRHEKNEHGADTKRNGDANNAEGQLNDVFAPKGPTGTRDQDDMEGRDLACHLYK
jgi:hypothetical protein